MRVTTAIRLALPCFLLLPALCADGVAQAQQAGQPVVLDSVVAVVNNHAILSSDIHRAQRLSALDSQETANEKPDRRSELERLISRELIEEQMTPEEKKQAEPTEEQLLQRLALLRKELPACARYRCTSDAGWAAFLAANGLTEDDAKNYLRLQLWLLSFIENRFRRGTRISQDEIENYYRNTLLPQYPSGQEAPSLQSVAPRISEILLQQQVTQLFSAWLDNLRKQGDVEILDPALAPKDESAQAGGGQ